MRSDSQPATAEVSPQVIDVSDTRLATSGMVTSRSRAMSSRKGARVVPLDDAANEPKQAAAISAHGSAAAAALDMRQPPAVPSWARSSRSRGSIAA